MINGKRLKNTTRMKKKRTIKKKPTLLLIPKKTVRKQKAIPLLLLHPKMKLKLRSNLYTNTMYMLVESTTNIPTKLKNRNKMIKRAKTRNETASLPTIGKKPLEIAGKILQNPLFAEELKKPAASLLSVKWHLDRIRKPISFLGSSKPSIPKRITFLGSLPKK